MAGPSRNRAVVSDPAPSLSDSNADPDQSLIQFNENFRKAKRNTLAWSSISILSTIGVSSDSAPVPLFATGLQYPQTLLVILAFVVAVFMILGYVRAERIVIIKSSQFFLENEAGKLANAFETLSDALNEKVAIIKDMSVDVTSLSAGTTQIASEIYHSVMRGTQQLNEVLFFSSVIGEENEGIKEFSENIRATKDEDKIEGFRRQIEEKHFEINHNVLAIEKTTSGYLSQIERTALSAEQALRMYLSKVQNDEKKISENIRKLISEIEEISKASTKINKFHISISRGEKLWHVLLDRIPSYGSFMVAAILFGAFWWPYFR